MFGRRFQRSIQSFVALLLIVTLSACIGGSRRELFAPELNKSYVLTENLVHTSLIIVTPGLFQPAKRVPYVMTRDRYDFAKDVNFDPDSPRPLPNFGEVKRGSRIKVKQMFLYNDFNSRVRHSKLQFTNPKTGEQLTVYSNWEDISPKLKEVQ